jgi:hypothetical protein
MYVCYYLKPLPWSGARLPGSGRMSVLDRSGASSPDTARQAPLSQLLSQTLSPFNSFLKIAHVNSQSLLCHIDEFRTIFELSNFDLILVSETWLKPNLSDHSVELPNYTLFRNDRLCKVGGGVGVFVKSSFPTSILYSSDNRAEGRPEFMFLDVCVNSSHVLLAVCYRAPNVAYGAFVEFDSVLLDFLARYSHVVVMGDFNCDMMGPATHELTYLTTLFRSCDMTLLPLDATHHTATSDTLLDIIAVADPALVVHHGQYPAPGLSKHDLIFCVYSLTTPKSSPKFITYRNLNAINVNCLLFDAYLMPWHLITSENDVDVMVNLFNNFITILYDKHAPLVTKRVTKKPAPWLTDFLRQLQRQRDVAFRRAKRTKSPVDWVAYKRLRNSTQQQFRNAKVRFYYTKFSRNQTSKSLWTSVKELGIGKTKCENLISLDLNTINDYFVNIPIDLAGARDYVTELSTTHLVRPLNQFSFVPVTEADVLGAVVRMSSNAVGADKIPIKLIKYILPAVLPVVTTIFNKSLSTSIFPSHWKSAVVRPLQKIKSPLSPSDFRPISILCALSKCLERVVHQQFSSFIERNYLLSNFQSGFRPLHSTTTALLKITDDIRSAIDKSQATILTLFDFSKAFDSVYHPLLFIKMVKGGFSDGCVNWVRSYLTGRQQCVSANGRESDWQPVTRGVPQGSVLGPLLFSYYLNDITTVIKHSNFHLYADDLQIYTHFPLHDFNNIVVNMNFDIEAIAKWAYRHGLKLNENKTQAILLGTSRLINNIDLNTAPKLSLNDYPLTYCESVKNLGVIIGKNLNWTKQVTETSNRVFACIHSLKRFALYLPLNIKLLLVKTLAFSLFNYCDSVINDMTVELSDKLQRVQNYCIRFVFNLKRSDHVTPYFNQLSILKLKELRKYRILMLLHAIINDSSPVYLSERFVFISQISSRSTRRGNSLLSIPIHRTVTYNKSFTVSACRYWNKLPDYIKNIEKRARFGAEVKSYLWALGD